MYVRNSKNSCKTEEKSSHWHYRFYKREEMLIKDFSKKIPILKAGNMSLGVNLLMYLTEIASKS